MKGPNIWGNVNSSVCCSFEMEEIEYKLKMETTAQDEAIRMIITWSFRSLIS